MNAGGREPTRQPQSNHEPASQTLDPHEGSRRPAGEAKPRFAGVETEASEGAEVCPSQGRMVLRSRARAARFHFSLPPVAPTKEGPLWGRGAKVAWRAPNSKMGSDGEPGQADTGGQMAGGEGEGEMGKWLGGHLETQTGKREEGR